ncbi:MAG: serine protease [Acidobacteria bacterium]|nr:MAG: serine protease [Acidobacteriota bacterium]
MKRALPVLIAATLSAGALAAQSSIESMSLMTTPVLLANGNRQVSQGTGFLYATTRGNVPDMVFLVTNYHVVTGNEPLSQAPPKGDRLQFYFHASREEPSSYFPVNIPLYTKTGEPIWIRSTEFPEADVVLVPIVPQLYDGRGQLFVFSEIHTQIDMKVRPATQATLLGYPYGFFDTKNFLPVWKTGHLASEPAVDFQGEPVFLVDVSAFPGMSGAPVVAVSNGVYENEANQMMSGIQKRLLGVFSAMRMVKTRPTVDASGMAVDAGAASPGDSLQLGYVWKASLVNDIARGFNRQDWEERIWKNRK